MQHVRDLRQHQWKPIFRVTEAFAGVPDEMSAKAFRSLCEIVRCGVNVSKLWIKNMRVEEASAAVVAQGLQLLMATPTQDRADCGNNLRELQLPVFTTGRAISAIFSALMVSPTAERLIINNTPMEWEFMGGGQSGMTREQRTQLWKWVALALFSRYAFMRSMGDDSLRISKQLHRISLDVKRIGAPLSNLVQIIDASLPSNVRLQTVDCTMSYQREVGQEDYEATDLLSQQHNGKPVALRAGPLSLPQKLAFCSALTACERNQQRAIWRLDHRVVSLIFEFAAECKKRTVSVWLRTFRNDEEDEHEDAEDEDDPMDDENDHEE